ncbi:MAG: hypothetical protein DLM66_13390 [Candidatus Dormiibacter spiritus]|nr:MAG: hypothetical protein DLM66_13390 [Candidatus Dormibacteraeota bacterium]
MATPAAVVRRCAGLAGLQFARPAPAGRCFSRWRNRYGGMKADQTKKLRRLRDENARLKAAGN